MAFLYSKLSSYIINSVPKTDIYLYCKCKQSTIERRFSQRPHRSFEDKYPSNYIEQLVDLYQKLSFPNDSIVIEIDTEAVDLREQNSVIEIGHDEDENGEGEGHNEGEGENGGEGEEMN